MSGCLGEEREEGREGLQNSTKKLLDEFQLNS